MPSLTNASAANGDSGGGCKLGTWKMEKVIGQEAIFEFTSCVKSEFGDQQYGDYASQTLGGFENQPPPAASVNVGDTYPFGSSVGCVDGAWYMVSCADGAVGMNRCHNGGYDMQMCQRPKKTDGQERPTDLPAQ
jgi:hypothetical protein